MIVRDPVTPCKYIYVARNPKDCAVSLFHHMRGFKGFEYSLEWDQHIENFMKVCESVMMFLMSSPTQGIVESSSWFDHVRPWWEHRNDENILFITYESMKADLAGAVRRIAGFIGVTDLTAEEVEKIAHLSTFESMKSDSKTNMMWNASKRKEAEQPFMRKGIVGMCVCVVG